MTRPTTAVGFHLVVGSPAAGSIVARTATVSGRALGFVPDVTATEVRVSLAGGTEVTAPIPSPPRCWPPRSRSRPPTRSATRRCAPAIVFGGTFAYGLLSAPGSPDVPFVPTDDRGRATRELLFSRAYNGFTGRFRAITPEVEQHADVLLGYLRTIQKSPIVQMEAAQVRQRLTRGVVDEALAIAHHSIHYTLPGEVQASYDWLLENWLGP